MNKTWWILGPSRIRPYEEDEHVRRSAALLASHSVFTLPSYPSRGWQIMNCFGDDSARPWMSWSRLLRRCGSYEYELDVWVRRLSGTDYCFCDGLHYYVRKRAYLPKALRDMNPSNTNTAWYSTEHTRPLTFRKVRTVLTASRDELLMTFDSDLERVDRATNVVTNYHSGAVVTAYACGRADARRECLAASRKRKGKS